MNPSPDVILWRADGLECAMITCCSGAELQLRTTSGDVIRRELYPSKSDLYERASLLKREHDSGHGLA